MSVGRVVLVAGVVAVVAAGCSSVPARGTITEKDHVPESSFWYSQCYAYSSSGGCTVSIPTEITTPECWDLELRNDAADPAETDSTCVERGIWDAVVAGQWFGPQEQKPGVAVSP